MTCHSKDNITLNYFMLYLKTIKYKICISIIVVYLSHIIKSFSFLLKKIELFKLNLYTHV